jgi:hypothetical protein
MRTMPQPVAHAASRVGSPNPPFRWVADQRWVATTHPTGFARARAAHDGVIELMIDPAALPPPRHAQPDPGCREKGAAGVTRRPVNNPCTRHPHAGGDGAARRHATAWPGHLPGQPRSRTTRRRGMPARAGETDRSLPAPPRPMIATPGQWTCRLRAPIFCEHWPSTLR